MGLGYRRQDSGLVLAEYGADGAAVLAALRQHDDDLRLIPPGAPQWAWKVYRYCGSERPAEFVLGWWDDDFTPRPLSMGLVDEVQRHDKNLRGDLVDAAVHNDRLKQERRKDYLRDAEAIVKEFGPKLDGKRLPVMHRSQSLRRARDKQRANQPAPELRP